MAFRVNVNIGDEINDWFGNEAKRVGITKSSLIAVALETYMTQKITVSIMGGTLNLYNQIDSRQLAEAKDGDA